MIGQERAELAALFAGLAMRFEAAVDRFYPESIVPAGKREPVPGSTRGPVSDDEIANIEQDVGAKLPVELIALFDMLRSGASYSTMSAFGFWLTSDVAYGNELQAETAELFEEFAASGEELVPRRHYLSFGFGDQITLVFDIDGLHPGRVILLICVDANFFASGRNLVDWARWRTALAEAGRVRRIGTDGVTYSEGLPRDEDLEKLAIELDVDTSGFHNY